MRFRRQRSQMPRLLLLLATAGAVFLMHSAFGSHCAGAMPMHHAESAMPDVVTMDVHHGASMTSVADARTVEKASAPSDCVMPGSCTFVLPGATAIIVLAILVLTVFGPRDLFIRLVIPRRVVLGRPPPWAIATHLSLGVLLR